MAELNGEEVADKEYDNFLEDVFVLTDKNVVIGDGAHEIIGVGCDRPHKSEELTNEAMSFIANPKNAKSAKTHRRCQNQRVKHCKEDATRELSNETALENHFSSLFCKGKQSLDTM